MGERLVPVPGVDRMFTDEDVEEILDYLDYEASLCPGCGHPRSETLDPSTEWEYVGHTVECHACAATARAMNRLQIREGVYGFATRRSAT